jgi:hypothetical protein
MPFPYSNLRHSKKRPVLLLRQMDHGQDDWLVCMVSSCGPVRFGGQI